MQEFDHWSQPGCSHMGEEALRHLQRMLPLLPSLPTLSPWMGALGERARTAVCQAWHHTAQ
jgi:hypothetical protein